MSRYQLEPHPIAATDPTVDGLEAALQTREDAWSGADSMAPAVLPDGSTVFLGGDTWTGGHRPDGRPLNGLVRNTLVKLKDGQLTAWYGPDRTATLTAGTDGTWLWPSTAVVSADTLKVLSLRMRHDPGPWGFAVDGHDISRVNLRDMAAFPSRPAPCPAGDQVTWNGSTVVYCRSVYLYGWRSADWGQVLARSSPSGFERIPWLFWTGTGWSPDLDAAAALAVQHAPLRSLWVFYRHGVFYASGHLVDASTDADVHLWSARTPMGPFAYHGPVARLPVPDGWMSYAGRVVQLGPCSPLDLVAMGSLNGAPGVGPVDVRRYGVHVVPVDSGVLSAGWRDV